MQVINWIKYKENELIESTNELLNLDKNKINNSIIN